MTSACRSASFSPFFPSAFSYAPSLPTRGSRSICSICPEPSATTSALTRTGSSRAQSTKAVPLFKKVLNLFFPTRQLRHREIRLLVKISRLLRRHLRHHLRRRQLHRRVRPHHSLVVPGEPRVTRNRPTSLLHPRGEDD